MTSSDAGGPIERSRARLARLCRRAEREADSTWVEALEEIGKGLDELSSTLRELESAEEQLSEARLAAERHARRYQHLFGLVRDAYVVTDERGVIREANVQSAEKLARSAHDLIGESLSSLVTTSDRGVLRECLSALRDRRERIEDRLIRFRSEATFEASVNAEAKPGDDGLEIHWMLRDLSEVGERDAFRDEIERHLEPVVWLIQLDPPRLLHISPAYEVGWGRSADALYEDVNDWLEALHPEDRERVATAFGRLLEGAPFDIEYRILRPDGELRWFHSRGNPFRDARGQFNRAAGIAEDVTEKRRVQAEMTDLERRRREAALAAEQAEARERRALARDLHDAVSQSLALARAKLGALREESDDADRVAHLEEVEALIAEADERTRTLTFRLSPPILHDLGLAAATEWLAEDMERRFGLHVVVRDGKKPGALATDMREAVFRSLRELLINVARHAQTDKASVNLVQEGETLTITVEDGGVGFDVGRSGAAGFGLLSVRERLQALGGQLEIESRPGRGTRVHLSVPVAESP